MTHAFPSAVAGCILVIASIVFRPIGLVLLWPAANFLMMAAAYRLRWHGVFGKRSDGTMSPAAAIWMGPMRVFLRVLWWFHVWLWEIPPATEVAPGLWLGRRVGARDLPDGVDMIVDLTAEFGEPKDVRTRGTYRCLPTLDSSAPPAEAFHRLVEEIAAWRGTVFIHCAVGYGRSATVAGAVLLARGIAERPGQALHILRQARPGVTLGRGQYRLWEELLQRQNRLA